MEIIGNIILGLLSTYYIVSGLTMIIMSLKTIKDIKNAKNSKIKLKNNYYIILPVLKEQNIIVESIDYFYDLTKYEEKVKVFVITTEREDDEYIKNPKYTTYDIAKNKINKLGIQDKIILLKAPREFIGKVGQMNFAYQYIIENNKSGYIGVYDIDSRPPKEIFYNIEHLLENKNIKTDIFQQASSYCNGIEQLEGIGGDFAIADAFSQTRWAIGFEYPIYKAYYNSVSKKKLRPLVYCIGHGCFVNTEYLKKIDGFPTFNKNDDLSLGYLTSTISGRIYPIPLLDFCQISRTALNSIKQYKFWFTGSSKYYSDVKYYMSKYNIELSKKQKYLFKIQGGIRNFLWAWRSNLIIFNLLLSILLGSTIHITLSLLSILSYVIVPYYITYFELKSLNKMNLKIRTLVLAPIISILNFIIRGIGPCMAMITNSKSKKNIEYKTER